MGFIVPPSVGSGDSPQLFLLPAFKFQALCRDLLYHEPEAQQCQEFGINGQAQYGIDLSVQLTCGGMDVAQCKAEKDFTPAKIREAADQFLKHWDYWKNQEVRRFLVLVGSEVSQTQRQEEIRKQTVRFRKLGIDFQLWPASKIVNKLRPHKGIVAQHLGAGWLLICGETGELAPSIRLAAITSLNQHLVIAISSATDERLTQMKDAWQSGQRSKTRRLIEAAKGDEAVWLTLSPITRANILRFEASISLDSCDVVDRISGLLGNAAELAPAADDLRLSAVLLWHQGDHQGALDKLDGLTTSAETAIRALMLLSLGRLTEAASTLIASDGDNHGAEYLRVEALCHFANGRIAEAALSMKKAEEKAPLSLIVRLAAGMVEYFSTLATCKIPKVIPRWPEPVDWTFVLRTDEATLRLKSAAKRFKDSLQIPDLRVDERHELEAWYIACLANMPDCSEMAQAELIALLDPQQVNFRLVVWATARFPHLNVDTSVQALRNAAIDGKASPEQIIALVHRYSSRRQWKKGLNILSKAQSLFSSAGAGPLWGFWWAQLTTLTGQGPEGEEVANRYTFSESDRRHLHAVKLRQKQSPDSLEELCAYLTESFAVTNDPQFLLEAMECRARAADWQFIASQAQVLFSMISTAEVLRLCAIGLVNAHKFKLCLDLLDQNVSVFPQSRMPAELRRIRVECQHALGATSLAIDGAAALAVENPTTESLYSLSQLYFATGDHRQHATTVLKLSAIEGVNTQMLLQLAWQTQWEDKQLAVKLWKKAAASLNDDDIVPAAQIGYSLGLDDELKGIVARMSLLGAERRAGVQLATLDDVRAYAVEFHRRAHDFGQAYDRGEIAIHAIANPLNVAIADIYHAQFNRTADAPFSWQEPCVWARHARRPLPKLDSGMQSEWRLTLDVTSLLVAYHFGFLAAVEKGFQPFRISSQLIPSLVLMQDRLTANQPQRNDAYAVIKQLLETGQVFVVNEDLVQKVQNTKIHEDLGPEWAILIREAARTGYIVAFSPLTRCDGTTLPSDYLPEELRCRVISQKDILKALLDHGPISQTQFDNLCERLGAGGTDPVKAVPTPSSTLYFAGTAIETLAGLGILPTIASRFRVFVTRQEVDRVNVFLRQARERAETATWVKSLITRLSSGINTGTYELLVHTAEKEPTLQADAQNRNEDLLPLRQVMCADAVERDRYWADDRWLNGHSRAGNMEIVDSVEVLARLVVGKQITKQDYFGFLGAMRAQGFHFVPLSAEEILNAFSETQTNKSGIVETEELINLRRGVAEEMLRSRILQRSSTRTSALDFGELAILIQHSRACSEALSQIWTDPALSKITRSARADWVMTSLYVDQHAIHGLAELPASGVRVLQLSAMSFATMLARAITQFSWKEKPWPGKEFLAWVFARMIGRRLKLEPELLDSTAELVKSILINVVPKTLKTKGHQATAVVIQLLVQNLPRVLAERLRADPDFMAKVKLKAVIVVELGTFRFDRADYLTALHDAVNKHKGEATLLQSNETAYFELEKQDEAEVYIRVFSTAEQVFVSDPLVLLCDDSAQRREAIAFHMSELFDLPSTGSRATLAALVSTEDIETRLRMAEELRENSMVAFYTNLSVTAASGISDNDLFPRSASSLLRHLRLNSDSAGLHLSVPLTLEALSGSIDSSLSDRLGRLFRLPVPLTKPITVHLATLPVFTRRALTKQLLKTPRTPLSQIHLAHLFLQVFGNEKHYQRLGRRMLRALVSDFSTLRPYLAFIEWSANHIGSHKQTGDWQAAVKLATAWAHGDRLFGIVQNANYDIVAFADQLALSTSLNTLFYSTQNNMDDVANPKNVEPETVLLCGLTYAFGDVTLDEPKLRESVAKVLSISYDKQYFPALGLISSTSTASDELQSMFGCDRINSLKNWISSEACNSIGQWTDQEAEEKLVEACQEGNCDMWLPFFAILGKFPLRHTLISGVEKAILASNFERRVATDPKAACAALYAATSIARFIPDGSAIDQLESQTLAVACAINAKAKDPTLRPLALSLVESTLNLSRRFSDRASGINNFSERIARMAACWPFLGEEIRPFIQRLCDELPLEETTELWRLNCRLRTQR